jgi:DNA invertase Pin-like site-specific DNA recombinase
LEQALRRRLGADARRRVSDARPHLTTAAAEEWLAKLPGEQGRLKSVGDQQLSRSLSFPATVQNCATNVRQFCTEETLRIIGYERVSTARQGASGLGIEAQRQAIEGFADQRSATIIARFTEVESGRNPDRPELGKALHLAKVTGATLVIAKLDRLSRNAAFLLTLRDSGVRFVAVDLPEANDLTVGIMALVAQQEREAISKRTKEALAVAKSRGVKLGNPNGAASLRRAGKGGAPLRAAIARNAHRHARDLAPVIDDIRGSGQTSLRAIADELNTRGMLTRRGGRWHVSTVTSLLRRLRFAEAASSGPGW